MGKLYVISATACAVLMAAGMGSARAADVYKFVDNANVHQDGVSGTADLFTHGNYGVAAGYSAGVFDSALYKNGKLFATTSVCVDQMENYRSAAPPTLYLKRLTDIDGTEAGKPTTTAVANKHKIAFLVNDFMQQVAMQGRGETTNVYDMFDLEAAPLAMNANYVSAGFQAAVWQLWGLGSTATGNVRTARDWFVARANAAPAEVLNVPYDVWWLYDTDTGRTTGTRQNDTGTNGFQNQLLWTDAPIPEPAFYQMSALLLLGGLGALKVRRRA